MIKDGNNSAQTIFVKLPKNLETGAQVSIVADGEYANMGFQGINLPSGDLSDVRLDDCLVRGGTFNANAISGLRLKNVRFEEVDLANCKFDKASFENVEFIKCRMTGIKVIEGGIRNALFKGCQLKLSQFRMSKLKNIQFNNCVLEESDFYAADMSDVAFSECDLTKTEFSATKLKEVDLRSSKIVGISISTESLKGTIIDPTQVNDLAWLLGAKIEWK